MAAVDRTVSGRRRTQRPEPHLSGAAQPRWVSTRSDISINTMARDVGLAGVGGAICGSLSYLAYQAFQPASSTGENWDPLIDFGSAIFGAIAGAVTFAVAQGALPERARASTSIPGMVAGWLIGLVSGAIMWPYAIHSLTNVSMRLQPFEILASPFVTAIIGACVAGVITGIYSPHAHETVSNSTSAPSAALRTSPNSAATILGSGLICGAAAGFASHMLAPAWLYGEESRLLGATILAAFSGISAAISFTAVWYALLQPFPTNKTIVLLCSAWVGVLFIVTGILDTGPQSPPILRWAGPDLYWLVAGPMVCAICGVAVVALAAPRSSDKKDLEAQPPLE